MTTSTSYVLTPNIAGVFLIRMAVGVPFSCLAELAKDWRAGEFSCQTSRLRSGSPLRTELTTKNSPIRQFDSS
ncbi:hypothetical protein PGTUg99_024054 [Puccinia graminis f. sp. tritici]|uniref:Uncharacterized protein n=1 Tax=Puccinia graminis f. sp. tritici TaxID=56615 RepID=A0A5B0LSA4_PUCGR|nr:hypothetical protein PGTUg99_024054 [Puccinia graminis f. sp. tritici]